MRKDVTRFTAFRCPPLLPAHSIFLQLLDRLQSVQVGTGLHAIVKTQTVISESLLWTCFTYTTRSTPDMAAAVNYQLVIACALIVVSLLLYFFYWNRLLASFINVFLRVWGWKAGTASIWIQFRE